MAASLEITCADSLFLSFSPLGVRTTVTTRMPRSTDLSMLIEPAPQILTVSLPRSARLRSIAPLTRTLVRNSGHKSQIVAVPMRVHRLARQLAMRTLEFASAGTEEDLQCVGTTVRQTGLGRFLLTADCNGYCWNRTTHR